MMTIHLIVDESLTSIERIGQTIVRMLITYVILMVVRSMSIVSKKRVGINLRL